jgi:molybdopterin-synthase adenylyltransferase
VSSPRFARQILLFGTEGQAKIESTSVAIVGLGGLGSHVGQQLAYLGVRSFALIDHDATEHSNLNRLIGAGAADADANRPKVAVAERLIKSVVPSATVELVAKSFISNEGFAAIQRADFVFGCVDRDAPRLILNELCQAYRRRYLDIATDTDESGTLTYGGRLLYSVGGELCVSCKGLLNQAALREDFSSSAQREEHGRIYGVPASGLALGGPAVVSINGILASVAVTEFMVEITGLRPAQRSLEYKGAMGRLMVDRDPPAPDCPYCKGTYGQGDLADVQRYVRENWGERL